MHSPPWNHWWFGYLHDRPGKASVEGQGVIKAVIPKIRRPVCPQGQKSTCFSQDQLRRPALKNAGCVSGKKPIPAPCRRVLAAEMNSGCIRSIFYYVALRGSGFQVAAFGSAFILWPQTRHGRSESFRTCACNTDTGNKTLPLARPLQTYLF